VLREGFAPGGGLTPVQTKPNPSKPGTTGGHHQSFRPLSGAHCSGLRRFKLQREVPASCCGSGAPVDEVTRGIQDVANVSDLRLAAERSQTAVGGDWGVSGRVSG
jgi:hypothetical protein